MFVADCDLAAAEEKASSCCARATAMLCKSEGRELVSRVESKNANDNDGSQLTAQRQAKGVLIEVRNVCRGV